MPGPAAGPALAAAPASLPGPAQAPAASSMVGVEVPYSNLGQERQLVTIHSSLALTAGFGIGAPRWMLLGCAAPLCRPVSSALCTCRRAGAALAHYLLPDPAAAAVRGAPARCARRPTLSQPFCCWS